MRRETEPTPNRVILGSSLYIDNNRGELTLIRDFTERILFSSEGIVVDKAMSETDNEKSHDDLDRCISFVRAKVIAVSQGLWQRSKLVF